MSVAQGKRGIIIDKIEQAVTIQITEIGTLAVIGINRERVDVDAGAGVELGATGVEPPPPSTVGKTGPGSQEERASRSKL